MTRRVQVRSHLLGFLIAACCLLVPIRTLVAVRSDCAERHELRAFAEVLLAVNPFRIWHDVRSAVTGSLVRQLHWNRRKIQMQSASATPDQPKELLIIGAGVLGRRVAALWQKAFPESRVVGATLTENSHAELRDLGIEPVTTQELFSTSPLPSYQHVVFSAPPRRSRPDGHSLYIAAVRDAISLWNNEKSASAGFKPRFIFTSSASVFDEDDGGEVDETSPVSSSASAQTLLESESLVLEAGGTVLRFAGLYDVDRGPHIYWLKVGEVKGNPNGLINLVHYDDAAAAVVAALHANSSDGQMFVVADGTPITRVGICVAAHTAAILPDSQFPTFESVGAQGSGKKLNASFIREDLQWSPKYSSFPEFMSTQSKPNNVAS